MGSLQFKRGLKANLPSSAAVGTPLWCTDTNELYIGTGSSVEKVGGSDGSSVEIDAYTKSEIDEMISDFYTKAEIDEMFEDIEALLQEI